MANLNILSLLTQIKNGNPRAVAEQIIQTNYPNDPMMQELLRLGKNGNKQSLEQFATQYFRNYGRDFNAELSNFMATVQNM